MTSVDHPLAGSKKIKLKDLLDYPAILPAKTTFTRQLVEKLFAQNRLQLDIGMSTNYLETIKMMVSVGMAWSVLPLTMVEDTLELLPMGNVSLQRKLGYIYHQDHTLSNAAEAFIRLLEQHRCLVFDYSIVMSRPIDGKTYE